MISPAGYGKIYSKQAARRIRLGAAAPVRALREPPAPPQGGGSSRAAGAAGLRREGIGTARPATEMEKFKMQLAIFGYGHMGSAIIEGALRAGCLKPSEVTVCEKTESAAKKAAASGLRVTASAKEAAKGAQYVIAAVKPSNLPELANELDGVLDKDAIIVSICAGKSIETVSGLFKTQKIIRVMPNAPALVGEGMSAICCEKDVPQNALDDVCIIFKSFGRAEILPEKLFDVVTAVSGSGPAYVYSFIDGLKTYAEENGMTPKQAKIFAAQTVLGSAKMVLSSDDSPRELKERICTPGGTTVEAVKVLDAGGFEGIIKDAAKACEEKSAKIGRGEA